MLARIGHQLAQTSGQCWMIQREEAKLLATSTDTDLDPQPLMSKQLWPRGVFGPRSLHPVTHLTVEHQYAWLPHYWLHGDTGCSYTVIFNILQMYFRLPGSQLVVIVFLFLVLFQCVLNQSQKYRSTQLGNAGFKCIIGKTKY